MKNLLVRKRLLTFLLTILSVVSAQQLSLAGEEDSQSRPSIVIGAIELGFSGALTAVEGLSQASFALRTGTFVQAPGGLTGFEIELAYSHVRSLDLLDVQGLLSWQRPLGETSLYVHVSLGGGLREEWLGSFRQVRYPIGFNSGIRALFSQRAAIRFEYKFRRILQDPISNFSEHQLAVGVSMFFRNAQ